MRQDFDLAVDAGHDVFWSGYTANNNHSVIDFPGGAMPGTVLPMTGGQNLLVDNANNLLYLVVNGHAYQMTVYAPPYTGSPIETITLKGDPQVGNPTYCALNKSSSRLDCGDSAYQSVDIYRYPSGKYSYSFLLPENLGATKYRLTNAPAP